MKEYFSFISLTFVHDFGDNISTNWDKLKIQRTASILKMVAFINYKAYILSVSSFVLYEIIIPDLVKFSVMLSFRGLDLVHP